MSTSAARRRAYRRFELEVERDIRQWCFRAEVLGDRENCVDAEVVVRPGRSLASDPRMGRDRVQVRVAQFGLDVVRFLFSGCPPQNEVQD